MNYLYVALIVIVSACQGNSQQKETQYKNNEASNKKPVQVQPKDSFEFAYFASGCFWCVEAIYESVYGVKEVTSGYSGGHTQNPTYESSNTGRTGHAETVEVMYDPEKISFSTLINIYFASQNPTQINGQGPDRGSQYRSIIFYQNIVQKEIILKKKLLLSKELNAEIAAEVVPFEKFWIAEAYHQDYEKRNPANPYIRNVSIPRLKRFQSKLPNVLKTSIRH
ncbi:peptide-methionine (S)-S-oxide reductase MsrA [Aquimarina sp. W85]|uniref:peptide-methionine (S)-S-oxide reductase MsrA n=1 Tax=Aquimarina rhodophyticola TaxID=3342246 RepID=UPI00366A5E61